MYLFSTISCIMGNCSSSFQKALTGVFMKNNEGLLMKNMQMDLPATSIKVSPLPRLPASIQPQFLREETENLFSLTLQSYNSASPF